MLRWYLETCNNINGANVGQVILTFKSKNLFVVILAVHCKLPRTVMYEGTCSNLKKINVCVLIADLYKESAHRYIYETEEIIACKLVIGHHWNVAVEFSWYNISVQSRYKIMAYI